jgi:hypothetical protein
MQSGGFGPRSQHMAVIYLRHPVHGAKVACSDMEANFDISHGWEVFDPTAPADPPAPEPPQVNELPRRGRPRRIAEPNGE